MTMNFFALPIPCFGRDDIFVCGMKNRNVQKFGRGGGNIHRLYDEIISLENLFVAWKEFRRGKGRKRDVQVFEMHLEDHLFDLHQDLQNGTYRHGPYESFFVNDPKRRHIHKPSVRDRVLHHAIVRIIEPIFDRGFIYDSWSCRKGKGTHAAIRRFQRWGWELSRNNTKTVWVLKMDVQKYFASVDHQILLLLFAKQIQDRRLLALLENIVESFPQGIPLGNLTSQLFANVYLNELDQFVKQVLRCRCYLRYCDDVIFLDHDVNKLESIGSAMCMHLQNSLHLEIHPRKIRFQKYHTGVDVLGCVCFPYHRILRTATRRRAEWRIARNVEI